MLVFQPFVAGYSMKSSDEVVEFMVNDDEGLGLNPQPELIKQWMDNPTLWVNDQEGNQCTFSYSATDGTPLSFMVVRLSCCPTLLPRRPEL